MTAEEAFRELRGVWFDHVLYRGTREREWETEEDGARREQGNAESWKLFDAQTEDILRGESAPVAPRCLNDMTKGDRRCR